MGQPAKTKTRTTQTRNVAPMGAEESLLQSVNTRAAQQQAQYLQQAMQAQQAYEQSPFYSQLMGLGQQAGQGLQGMMGGQQLIMPGQQQALQTYFQSLMNPAMEQMQRTAGQEAARRGMTISDSPIGGDYLRNLASYQAQMGGQQAKSALDLSGQNQQMYQNILGLTQNLGQNAAQNRFQLASARPGSYDLGSQLAQSRIASAPITQTTRGPGAPFGQQFGQYASGLNNALGAAQGGLNLYAGTYKGSTPGIRDLWR